MFVILLEIPEIFNLRAATHGRKFRIQLNKIRPRVGIHLYILYTYTLCIYTLIHTSSGTEEMSQLFDEVFMCIHVERSIQHKCDIHAPKCLCYMFKHSNGGQCWVSYNNYSYTWSENLIERGCQGRVKIWNVRDLRCPPWLFRWYLLYVHTEQV